MFFSLIVLGMNFVQAQSWEFGVQGGTSGYMGDLNPENPFKFNDWTIGALGRYNINGNYSLRLNVLRANIWGSSSHFSEGTEEYNRNLAFQSALYEASFVGELNFFRFIPCLDKIYYTPYIFAGIGATHFNPRRNINGQWVTLYDKPTEAYDRPYSSATQKYSRVTWSIPLGIGFKYNFMGPWSVGVELGYRFAMSDHLDDVSGMYPDFDDENSIYSPESLGMVAYDQELSRLLADPSGLGNVAGTMRGDSRRQDSYMLFGFSVTYAIFKKGCPLFYKK